MAAKKQQAIDKRIDAFVNKSGTTLVKLFHYLGLFAIGAATVWASIYQFMAMFQKSSASIQDILILFIYLEIGAMVGIYFKTTHLPVRYLIYIAITALTKLIVHFTTTFHEPVHDVLLAAGAIVLLSFAVMILRYGSHSFPSIKSELFQSKQANNTVSKSDPKSKK